MLERLTPSRAHCPTIGNEGCSRSTISRRRTGLLGQEIPLHLQLADLLVQPGDQSGVALGLLVLTIAEHTGGSLGQGLLPGLNLARVDFVPDGQLGHWEGLLRCRSDSTHAAQGGIAHR